MQQQRSRWFNRFAIILLGPLLAYLCSKSWRSWQVNMQQSSTSTLAAYDPEGFIGLRLSSSQHITQLDLQQLDAELAVLKQQLERQITSDVAKQQLLGAKLPPKVSLAAARQLLIDKQLLQHSIQYGHAAVRGRTIMQHHNTPRSAAADANSSRGILIVGGSRSHLGNAYILLRTLRQQLNCTLPIEIVYYGPQELDPAAAVLISSFITAQAAAGQPPMSLIDGSAVHKHHLQPLHPHPEVRLSGWVAKIHALCWVTSFQKVLYLDSDTLPTQDPSLLFLTPEFESREFLIWPDFWRDLWMWPAVYKLLGLAVPWEAAADSLSAESGQIVINRVEHWDVLEWLWMVNTHSELVYECVVGDKDTFKMAFELAGKANQYYQVPHPPMELLADASSSSSSSSSTTTTPSTTSSSRNRYFHLGMAQSSPDGTSLLFLHRTARGKLFPWCAAKRQLSGQCQPAVITLPVAQEQLLASVRDAGSMRFDADKIDMQWWLHNCYNTVDNSTLTASSSSSSKDQNVKHQHTVHWAMLLPGCNYTLGQLPIPAIPTTAVAGLTEYLQQLDKLFMDVQKVLPVQFWDRIKVFLGKL